MSNPNTHLKSTQPLNSLAEYRKDRRLWEKIAYCKMASTPDGSTEELFTDRHEKARYALLLALQYDWHKDDHELIRFLFDQEVIARESETLQGMGEALELAAFLLAKLKSPDDIARLYRAKYANFDTECGFDIEFLFWPLAEESMAYLSVNQPEILARLKEAYDIEEVMATLDRWWQRISRRYPDNMNQEQDFTLYQRALYFDDLPQAEIALERWRTQEPESAHKSRTLRHAYQELKQYDKAIQILLLSIACADTGWDKASLYRELIELYTLVNAPNTVVNAPTSALASIMQLAEELRSFDKWKLTGLGYRLVEATFDYSLACRDLNTALQAFQYADSWREELRFTPLTALTKGWLAAEKCQLTDKEQQYKTLAQKEHARIEAL